MLYHNLIQTKFNWKFFCYSNQDFFDVFINAFTPTGDATFFNLNNNATNTTLSLDSNGFATKNQTFSSLGQYDYAVSFSGLPAYATCLSNVITFSVTF